MTEARLTEIKHAQSKNRNYLILNYVLAILTFVGFGILLVYMQPRALDFSGIQAISSKVQLAFLTTLRVSFTALIGSMVFGLLLYFLSISKIKYFRAFTDVFTEIIYGTPLLVMIFMMGFAVRSIYNFADGSTMGLIGLTVYITPYMANIFRAAFSNIPNTQYQAMDLFGFTLYQRYRYIIIPQMIRVLMAPLMNNFSLIIKGSALLYIVSTDEIFNVLYSYRNETGRSLESFFVMWVLYIMITLPLSMFTKYIERRWRT